MRVLLALSAAALAAANGIHDVNGNLLPNLAAEEITVASSGSLGDRPLTIDAWAHQDKTTRGPAPYTAPKDGKYNTGGGPVEGKINVHITPHTHDDTG